MKLTADKTQITAQSEDVIERLKEGLKSEQELLSFMKKHSRALPEIVDGNSASLSQYLSDMRTKYIDNIRDVEIQRAFESNPKNAQLLDSYLTHIWEDS